MLESLTEYYKKTLKNGTINVNKIHNKQYNRQEIKLKCLQTSHR